MVSEKGDIPDREDAKPSGGDKIALVKEITDTGEAEVHVSYREEPYECHRYDTYVFDEPRCFYTEDDDEEAWVFPDEITAVHRH